MSEGTWTSGEGTFFSSRTQEEYGAVDGGPFRRVIQLLLGVDFTVLLPYVGISGHLAVIGVDVKTEDACTALDELRAV